MEFVIARDVEISYFGPSMLSTAGIALVGRESNEYVHAKIEETKDDLDGTDNQKYSKKLTTVLNRSRWTHECQKSVVDWRLKVGIYFPDPNPGPSPNVSLSDDGKVKTGSEVPTTLKIYAASKCSQVSFLEVLYKTFNLDGGDLRNISANLTVKDFGLKNRTLSSPLPMSWKSTGTKLSILRNEMAPGLKCLRFKLRLPEVKPEERLLNVWKSGQSFSGFFTISVVLSCSALSVLDSLTPTVAKERFGNFKKMLVDGICTDLEIIAGGGPGEEGKKVVVVKCHRAVLAAGSEVFRRMFESGMKEATGNRVEIEEMSGEGVRAMLSFMYYGETKAVYESCEIALELLQAGEKYDVRELKDCVRDYMIAKGSEWFGVDMVLGLYGFVRALCLEEMEDPDGDVDMSRSRANDGVPNANGGGDENEKWKGLKIKCLKVLKWYNKKKPKALLESEKYKEIYREDFKLGMEITAGMLRLD